MAVMKMPRWSDGSSRNRVTVEGIHRLMSQWDSYLNVSWAVLTACAFSPGIVLQGFMF
jgi:hypothetical protein